MNIRVTIKGVDAIAGKLKRFPAALPIFLTVVSQTLVPGLKEYAPWKRVTRKQAYGVTFFSKAQQRAFFAKLNEGGIPYNRSGEQGKAWRFEGVRGNTATIANRLKSVIYTRGQTSLHRLMGWTTALAQVNKDLPKAIAAGWRAMRAYIGL